MWSRQDIEDLYRRHGFAVLRRCRHLLGDDAEAQDMMQEVFLRALERSEQFRGSARESTYLYAVATNLCLNRIRNTRARGAPWLGRMHASLPSHFASMTEQTEARAALTHVLTATDELDLSIAVYHYVDGLSQGEIAKLVKLSRITINKRLKQFRQAARSLLATEEATDVASP